MKRIVDLHIHVVPRFDDGSPNIETSMEMVRAEVEQGVTDIFCTSHSGYFVNDKDTYENQFLLLKQRVSKEFPSINLYRGCEVLCTKEYIDKIIFAINNQIFPTLGNSKCVLTEFYPDTELNEAVLIINKLKGSGYIPIIAHMERNVFLVGRAVSLLLSQGAYIQVNACSFVDETDMECKANAQCLLNNKQVHFIGSDAHRMSHRPPRIKEGVDYIYSKVEEEYAESILFNNSKTLLNVDTSNS